MPQVDKVTFLPIVFWTFILYIGGFVALNSTVLFTFLSSLKLAGKRAVKNYADARTGQRMVGTELIEDRWASGWCAATARQASEIPFLARLALECCSTVATIVVGWYPVLCFRDNLLKAQRVQTFANNWLSAEKQRLYYLSNQNNEFQRFAERNSTHVYSEFGSKPFRNVHSIVDYYARRTELRAIRDFGAETVERARSEQLSARKAELAEYINTSAADTERFLLKAASIANKLAEAPATTDISRIIDAQDYAARQVSLDLQARAQRLAAEPLPGLPTLKKLFGPAPDVPLCDPANFRFSGGGALLYVNAYEVLLSISPVSFLVLAAVGFTAGLVLLYCAMLCVVRNSFWVYPC